MCFSMSDHVILQGFLLITTAVMIWHKQTFVRISGPTGRRFKSCHLDQFVKSWNARVSRLFCFVWVYDLNDAFAFIHLKSCFCAQKRIIMAVKTGVKPLWIKDLSVLPLWTIRAQTASNYVLRSACMALMNRKNKNISALLVHWKKRKIDWFFTISDNGRGIDPFVMTDILTKRSQGYGVENVHARAQLHYGHEFGVSYRSRAGEGTDAILTIPKTMADRESSLALKNE